MKYFYTQILRDDGRLLTALSKVPVDDYFEARTWLEARNNGFVVRLVAIPEWIAATYTFFRHVFGRTVASHEVAGLLRDLALMTSAGIPILESICACLDDPEAIQNKGLHSCINEIRCDLQAGASVTDAFDRQSAIFPGTIRSLIAIGDETGSMDKRLLQAADHMERIIGMRSSAKQALIYPSFVFLAIFGAASFWIYYVIPNLSGLFRQMNVKLPHLTLLVMAFADWFTKNVPWIAAGVFFSIFSMMLAWNVSLKFRQAIYALLHRVPIAKEILKSSGLAFFSEYLSILNSAGLDVVRSFGVLQKTMTDEYYRTRIIQIRYLVERGERISSAMRRVGGFPNMIVRMISVGENSGSLDRQLLHLSNEYRTRLDRLIGALSEIIKPMIILVAGAFFILIIMALLLPIYDLVRQAMANRY